MDAYKTLEPLQTGGQGAVFRAEAPDGSTVALKRLLPSGSPEEREAALARFRKEATCQAGLVHPGIMPILSVEVGGDEPFIVMPLAEGSIRDRLNASTDGIDEGQAIEWMRQMLQAMEYAHAERVLHRDLKPENVLILDGRAVIGDFGFGRRWDSDSTRVTMTHDAFGTFGYSAPEQFVDASRADERADVFALGKILYEMLSGERTFGEVDLEKVPAKFRFVLAQATKSKADDRFQSVREMAAAFENALRPGGFEDPLKLFETLVGEVLFNKAGAAARMLAYLIENADDPLLYLQRVTELPVELLRRLSAADPTAYATVVDSFVVYADTSHPWSFTDRLAVFADRAATDSATPETRLALLRVTLRIAYAHNRWFVRDTAVAMAKRLAKDPQMVPYLASMFREEQRALEFSRDALLGEHLPAALRSALRNEQPPTSADAGSSWGEVATGASLRTEGDPEPDF